MRKGKVNIIFPVIIVLLSLAPLFFNYPLNVALTFAIPICLLVFLKPYIGVILLVLLVSFSFNSETVSYTELLFSFIFLLTLAGSIVKLFLKKTKLYTSPLFLPLLLTEFSCLISFFPAVSNSVDPSFWLRRTFPFLLFLVAIPIFVELESSGKRFINFFLFLLLVISLYNIAGIAFHWYISANLLETVENPQVLREAGNGIYFIYLIVMLLYLLMVAKNKLHRVLLNSLLLFSITMVLLSFTRSYWVGIFFALVYLLLMLKKGDRKKFISILLTQLFVGGIVYSIAHAVNPFVQHKIGVWLQQLFSSIFPFTQDFSAMDRIQELKALIPLILKSPLWGYGLGSTYTFYSVNPFSWGKLGKLGYVSLFYSHNFYAYHAYATGLIGLISFLFLLWKGLIVSIRFYSAGTSSNTKLILFLSAVIFALLFTSLTSPQFVDKASDLYVGIILGIIAYIYSKSISSKVLIGNAELDYTSTKEEEMN